VNKQDIVQLLKINDKAVARALVVLTQRQTDSEQATKETRFRNGEGFRPCHAHMGTSMANFFASRGFLTPKQIAYWRCLDKNGKMRIEVYANQLLGIAQAKTAVKCSDSDEPPAPDCNEPTGPNPYNGEDVGNMMERQMVLQEQLDDAFKQQNHQQINSIKLSLKLIAEAIKQSREQ